MTTTTELPTVLDVWESYPTRDGAFWVVILNDDKRTTFTFDQALVPAYIVISEEYGHVSLRNTLPDPDSRLNEIVKIWRVR